MSLAESKSSAVSSESAGLALEATAPPAEVEEGVQLRCEGEERIRAAASGRVLRGLKALQTPQCPFKNLPEKKASRWGESLTAEKIHQCRWVKPNWSARLLSSNGLMPGTCAIASNDRKQKSDFLTSMGCSEEEVWK